MHEMIFELWGAEDGREPYWYVKAGDEIFFEYHFCDAIKRIKTLPAIQLNLRGIL